MICINLLFNLFEKQIPICINELLSIGTCLFEYVDFQMIAVIF
jgi:hypothetical protein